MTEKLNLTEAKKILSGWENKKESAKNFDHATVSLEYTKLLIEAAILVSKEEQKNKDLEIFKNMDLSWMDQNGPLKEWFNQAWWEKLETKIDAASPTESEVPEKKKDHSDGDYSYLCGWEHCRCRE